MNILLTNEAGCFAPGITALAKALSVKHRVVIVAPLQPQFNCGHAWTYSAPLRIKQYNVLNKVKVFSVDGTSCDCVAIALDKVLHSKPDLIIAGIRPRHSRGEVIYASGIVCAAMEGTIQGIPSIAVSAKVKNPSDEKNFAPVANAFAKNLSYFLKNMSPQTTLNVNFPEKFSMSRIVCTNLTCNMMNNKYAQEVNPFGNTFFWLLNPTSGYKEEALEQHGDLYWLLKDYITVTPLKLDLTADEAIEIVERAGLLI